MCVCVYMCIFFHHTTCESMCDTHPSSAANQGDNTVSVAQGGTAIPGATKQLLNLSYLDCFVVIFSLSIYKQNLILNHPQGLTCHKTPTNQCVIDLQHCFSFCIQTILCFRSF